MSAFLGPIHYWLYNKIQIQQAIVDEIHNLGAKYDLTLKEDCDARYGMFEIRPLEEMIDLSNIHGWLQEKVSMVEYKYAYSVKSLLDKNPSSITDLDELLTCKGKELAQTVEASTINSPMLFKIISDNLLDGMPCDHANSILDKSDDRIVWKRNLCVHTDYWDAVGADISLYYQLREAWILGLVMECGFTFQKIDPVTYSIETATN